MPVPVAAGVAARVRENTHPGLQIDKYVDSWHPGTGDFSGQVQRPAVERAADLPAPPGVGWADLFARHTAFLDAVGAARWDMTTAGPLTLHLARASALENAGLCLHRVYGFAYIPGTGLKGMARSYAETVAGADRAEVAAVFGHLKEKGDESAAAGAVVFHDAWPVAWPKLVPDILNSHHSRYYQGTDAPGDWDEPNMVSFLAVAPGQGFRFAVAGRRADVDPRLVERAREWLTLALIHEGAGAKTAAGYGGFRMANGGPEPAAPKSPNRERWEGVLELVTPAFLAGANQQPADCELRPATLRGQLRWWWRTLHAGFVDVPTLRRLEAAVWGDTNAGGAVRVAVEPLAAFTPVLFDRAAVVQRSRLPRPENEIAAQGLTYCSYGTDERGRRRAYLPPGSKWAVRMTARPGKSVEIDRRGKVVREVPLRPEWVLGQARAALGLLCQLGGVGSKSRNGFGSFADQPGFDLPAARRAAAEFRAACGLAGGFQPARAESLALEELVPAAGGAAWAEVPTPWRDPWFALDQVGATMQSFAQGRAHNPAKLALGLPRQIHGPRPQPLPHQRGRPSPPQRLRGPKGDRHAAPVFYHLTATPGGGLTVRVTAMVARHLPDAAASRTMLAELMAAVPAELTGRAAHFAGGGGSAPPPTGPTRPTRRESGARARVKLLAARPKGGWDVQEEGRPAGTLTLGSPPPGVVPEAGGEVDVLVHVDDPAKPQYKWPAPPPAGGKPPPKGGQGKR